MHDAHVLTSIIIALATAVCIVALFKRLNISPVLGYFVAGAALGPSGFAILTPENTSMFAEFGIIFLLFAIGLELTIERLMAMRGQVFGFGTMQVVITGGLIAMISHYSGSNLKTAIILGGGLALSSTAIVMQVLAESGKQYSQVGRLSLAVLILQDFAVVPLLVLVPLLADGQSSASIGTAVIDALMKAVVAMIVIFILGRLLCRPLFKGIASLKSEELFVATTLLTVLGTAYVTHSLGLSLALGAFIAGLLVAETEYRHHAEDSIKPFKGLFLGLFFMSVGMSIDLNVIQEKLPEVLLYASLLIIGKAAIIILLCQIWKFPSGAAFHAGLTLSQGGEFAFILFSLTREAGIINTNLAEVMLLVVTLTMALTPLLSRIGEAISDRLDPPDSANVKNAPREIGDLNNHIIIAGFGKVGQMVARVLEAERIHYLAVDINAQGVLEARDSGIPVYHGNSTSVAHLEMLGIERATAVILAINDPLARDDLLHQIHLTYPDLPIIVRVQDMREAEKLRELGAWDIVPESYETGLQLAGSVLKSIGISSYEISRLKNQFRAGDYLKAQPLDELEVEQ